MSLKTRYKQLRSRRLPETGFTIIELVVILGIIGILAAIAFPIYTNIMNVQHENEVKQKLSQAAMLLEQEAIDNNGYLPKYVPNEITEDPVLARFSYEHKDRVEWCITATITKNSLIPFFTGSASLWFASSNDTTPSKTNICGGTGFEPLEGSSAPWSRPDVSRPSVASHQTQWPITSNNASIAVTSSASTCTFPPEEADLFADVTATLNYRMEVKDIETGRTRVITTEYKPGTGGHAATLAGFYPGDRYEVRVQAKCILSKNGGHAWEYTSEWSQPVQGTLDPFIIPAPTVDEFKINVGVGGPLVKNLASAKWTPQAECPAGSERSYYSEVVMSSAWDDWNEFDNLTTNSMTNVTLENSTPGHTHFFGVKMKCTYPATGADGPVTIMSDFGSSEATRAALRPPTGELTINGHATNDPSILITPNAFIMSASNYECAAGNLLYETTVTDAAGNIIGEKRATTPSTVVDYTDILLPEVNKDVFVEATVRCSGIVDGAMQISDYSPDSSRTKFTIRYRIPPVPSPIVTTTFSNDGNGGSAISNDRLLWTAVTCETGSTPEYQVRQIQKTSKQTYTAANRPVFPVTKNTTQSFTTANIAPGGTTAFEVRSRCTNAAGSSAWTGYVTGAGAKWTTAIKAPTAQPTPGAANGNISAVSFNAATCQAGIAAINYRIVQTRYEGTTNGTWATAWGTGRSSIALPKWGYGRPIAVRAEARCHGDDAVSAVKNSSSYAATSPVPTPAPWESQPVWRSMQLNHNCGSWSTTMNSPSITVKSPVFGTKVTNGTYYVNQGQAWGAADVTLKVRCKTTWATGAFGTRTFNVG